MIPAMRDPDPAQPVRLPCHPGTYDRDGDSELAHAVRAARARRCIAAAKGKGRRYDRDGLADFLIAAGVGLDREGRWQVREMGGD